MNGSTNNVGNKIWNDEKKEKKIFWLQIEGWIYDLWNRDTSYDDK